MTIRFLTKKQSVTDRDKEVATKKLSKLSKFFPDEANATVNFIELKNEKKKVELTIFSNGTIFRSEIEENDYISAIEKAVDVIEGQIRKNKSKLKKRLRDGALDKFADEADENHSVVRTKEFTAGVMDTDEAILEMEISDHSFFVFKNAETERINIVYKRNDGAYGLLIPD